MSRFNSAKEQYAAIGVDVDAALKTLDAVAISMHCWQGDDVAGFERAGELSGGIAATGNYPGKARDPDELLADIDLALSLIPGKHRLNLHAIYAITPERVDRDRLETKHFAAWLDFARQRGLGLDFNPTFFSHPNADGGMTLASPDADIRRFWIDHGRATRRIAADFGRELGTPCLHNVWVPDGCKNSPSDRLGPRARLQASLDELFAEKFDPAHIVDSVESKVFGIGVEAYTVGSHEFYLNYAAKNNVLCLMDLGHYHPTEVVSDKISAMLLFSDKVALHVSRPVRWDSDHVIMLDDELRELALEIVRCDALGRVLIGLDYFDASINRIAAWVMGMRNMQEALLLALLTPHGEFAALQDEGRFGELMARREALKLYPAGAVWDHYCESRGVPPRAEWYAAVKDYETRVLAKRS